MTARPTTFAHTPATGLVCWRGALPVVLAALTCLSSGCVASTGSDAAQDVSMSDDAGVLAGRGDDAGPGVDAMDASAQDGFRAGGDTLRAPEATDTEGGRGEDGASAVDTQQADGSDEDGADTQGGDDAGQDPTKTDAADGGPGDDATGDDATSDDGTSDDGSVDDSTGDDGTGDDATGGGPTDGPCAAKPDAPPVEAPPLPPADTCAWKSPQFFIGPPPAETLVPKLGIGASKTKPWTEIADQDFLAMQHGMQGSFHSFAAFRVELPGATGPYVKLQVEAWLSASCGIIALGKQPVVFAKPVAGQPGVYGNAEAGEGGVLLYFGLPGNQSVKFCNTWARLHVRVRRYGTQDWGSTSTLVRLYDGG